MTDFSTNFPNLHKHNCAITSPETENYNCIAWAASENDAWWWPGTDDTHYWPDGLPLVNTVENFSDAFATLGYIRCVDGSLEPGVEKLVLYVDAYNLPTHMSRQLQDGSWTSKLGSWHDISHKIPEDLDGPAYGSAKFYFKRDL